MANQTTQTQPTTSTWKLDPTHSTVEFITKHMMITTVRGRFNKADATIELNEKDVTKSSVEATIDVASLTTGADQRDTHLRTGDFFQVDQYPEITFKSTRIEPRGGDNFNIYGDLTVRGITRQVVLDTVIEGKGTTPYGSEVTSFFAKTTLNRKDFGLNWNVALETGGVLVSDTVRIELNIQAVKQAAA